MKKSQESITFQGKKVKESKSKIREGIFGDKSSKGQGDKVRVQRKIAEIPFLQSILKPSIMSVIDYNSILAKDKAAISDEFKRYKPTWFRGDEPVPSAGQVKELEDMLEKAKAESWPEQLVIRKKWSMLCQPKDTDEDKKKRKQEEELRKAKLLSEYFKDGSFNMTAYQGSLTELVGMFQAEKTSIMDWINNFAYSGFNPKEMIIKLCSLELDKDVLKTDILKMLGLFHLRGPNLNNIQAKCIATVDQKKELAMLIAKYSLAPNGKEPTDIT